MVHLVPDDGVDDGPVLATSTVELDGSSTLEAFEAMMHATEHRLLVDVLADVCRDPSIIDAAIDQLDTTGTRPMETEIHA